jgi:putative DNA methylase
VHQPPLLIESWLPIAAIGAESQRERGASSALPPLYFLHVWWARRPLIASRAAVLAGVLPAWSPDWPWDLRERFPNEESYHGWFLRFIGIRGDPAKGRKLIEWAKSRNLQLPYDPYDGAPRAFTVNPTADDLAIMGDLLEHAWGTRDISVADPFAGGGSIPFEALRYGFTTTANDLNPVAAVILKATLDYPARFGPGLADDIRKWGDLWASRVKEKLSPYFPKQPGESIFAYLWARTVACPTTGKPVPLSPNWWLRSGDDPVAVRLIAEPGMAEPQFEIVRGAAARAANPDDGTISRGVGRSPWTGETISGEYIKAEAQAGRMGELLYAVATKGPGGFKFRPPGSEDLAAARRAEVALTEKRPGWLARDVIPTEPRQEGRADWAAGIYGLSTWADAFASRQLLAMCTIVEVLGEIRSEIESKMPTGRANAVLTYLAVAFDKAIDYNSTQAVWHASRQVIAHAFQRHDFAFKWAFTEFDASQNLLPWVVDQVVDAYRSISTLAQSATSHLWDSSLASRPQSLHISRGNAGDLSAIGSASIQAIVVDPPYYDNVQYAELSDYFYVWLKRTVGDLYGGWFDNELVNKDDEAVASLARFAEYGGKRRELANQDYERKMAAAFREMHRVLRPDGVLTVMFTHKRVEAWDTLASALIGAGFVIHASWPVHTESEHSLHQAKKNAASSTILLVCRKRAEGEMGRHGDTETGRRGDGETGIRNPQSAIANPVWWDDLQGKVRATARTKAEEFAAAGIGGVDLYLSTFGPTLSIISEHWPVLTSEIDPKTGHPRPLRPETALDLARQEVVRLRKQGLLLGREIQFDPVTDWYLMAWADFGAEQFPYDEARKLAIALGVDLDKTIMAGKRLVTKKGEFVVLQTPVQRRRKGMVDDEVMVFESWIDAAHTAMMVYEEDGAGACEAFLRRSGLRNDGAFRALLQALLNAIPRSRVKGKFVRPEAEVLENMRLAFFDDLVAPTEEELELPGYVQMGLDEVEDDIADDAEQ